MMQPVADQLLDLLFSDTHKHRVIKYEEVYYNDSLSLHICTPNLLHATASLHLTPLCYYAW